MIWTQVASRRTAKNATNCCKLLIYRLVATCQQVATNLSISSNCNKSVNIKLVATCHLQTCYNLLKQPAANLWITNFDNQLAIDLLRQADIRMRSQGLRELVHDKSVASCQQTCCTLIAKTCYPQACWKLFRQVVTSLQMTSCNKPDFNRLVAT